MKKYLLLLVFLFVLPCVFSISNPGFINYPVNTNITYHINARQTSCNVSLYNKTGGTLINTNMTFSGGTDFNIVIPSTSLLLGDSYSVNANCGNESVTDLFTITSDGEKDPRSDSLIAILILLPLILGFFFIKGAELISDEWPHIIVKVFLYIMSLASFIASLWITFLCLVKWFAFTEMQDALGDISIWFGIVFFVVILYFAVWLTMMSVAEKKRKKEEKDEGY